MRWFSSYEVNMQVVLHFDDVRNLLDDADIAADESRVRLRDFIDQNTEVVKLELALIHDAFIDPQ